MLSINMNKEELEFSVKTNEDIGLSSDTKEANTFPVPANETIHSNPSNLLRGTETSKSVLLGKIIY